jgi:hypothetical protein
MHRVPWCVVLAAINDQPGRKKKKNEGEITSEDEAKEFFGLKLK